MSEFAVRTEQLTKRFGKNIGIEQVDLHLKRGEIYGLVGRNGAGKTTIMKLLCGILVPTEGKIEILGESFNGLVQGMNERMGNILETPAFFPYLSARENLCYYAKQRGIIDKKRVDELIRFVGLEGAGKKTFKQFSLGMKQRLGIAYALLAEPDILVLDEPTNGLDPQGMIHFRETMKRLAKEKNMSIIISTHILSELSQLATTYGFIKAGHLVREMSAQEIEESCKHHLLFTVDQPKVAATLLEEKLNTKQYEIIEDGKIKVFDHLDDAAKVNELFVLAGLKVSSLQQIKGSLEDYYMEIMGDEKHA